jgi:hypothetical protein
MDDVRRKMMGLITGFFMGLNEADKQILKSQLNTVDESQPGHHRMNIKSSFLNGIHQGKVSEEQRQHFYKVLHLAEQKWRTSKGFDDPEKMRTLMEKRGMIGVLESISCEPIDMGLSNEFYYPVRTNADQFEIEKIAENMLVYDNEIRFKKEFDNVGIKYTYNTYDYNVSYKNTIKENDDYFLVVFNKNNII